MFEGAVGYSYKHRNWKFDWITGFITPSFADGELLCGRWFARYLLFVCRNLSEWQMKRYGTWTGVTASLPVHPSMMSVFMVLHTQKITIKERRRVLREYLPKEIHLIITEWPSVWLGKHAEISSLHIHVHSLRERDEIKSVNDPHVV